MITPMRAYAVALLVVGVVVGIVFSAAEGVCLAGAVAVIAAHHVEAGRRRREGRAIWLERIRPE